MIQYKGKTGQTPIVLLATTNQLGWEAENYNNEEKCVENDEDLTSHTKFRKLEDKPKNWGEVGLTLSSKHLKRPW